MAQHAPPIADESSAIIVTGSRIPDNAASPTPLTVLTKEDMLAGLPANLSDLVNQLPAITPASTSGNSSGNLSNGLAGIASVNLRGLGASRTLVLLDGHRTVGSAIGGVVDLNTIPQSVVERVEVVTGGASAQYGSDAIGGVVNFILDKRFEGLRLTADQGLTTYGDAAYRKLTATAGLKVGRLRLLLNGEYFQQDAVATIDRSWNRLGYFQINNPAYTPTNGQPERIVGTGVAPATYAPGGLIGSGPLQGLYFLPNGSTGKLSYGQYNPAVGPWMVGGDTVTTLSGHLGSNSLVPGEERRGVFSHASFELSSRVTLFAQASWNRYSGSSSYQQTPSTGVTIQADNAFLLTLYPQVAARVSSLGLSSFSIGTSNAGFAVPGSANSRDVYRVLAGAEGDVGLFGKPWRWTVGYQLGTAKAHEELSGVWNVARMNLASDAVISGGSTVCRSTLSDPTNGCVPLNRLGLEGPSASAARYIYGSAQPQRDETFSQEVVNASVDGKLFALPGGRAAVALGVEWRRESVRSTVPQEFTSGWVYGNYQAARGTYEVQEAFGEVQLPFGPGLVISGAGRITDYSTSGTVGTWKTGGTWDIVEGLRFRGTFSRDIRAPNLQELYAGATSRSNAVIMPSNAPASGSAPIIERSLPNTSLRPERARNWTAGLAASPKPGLSASFDYFSTSIHDAIGSVTAQTTVNLCYSGAQVYCPNIIFAGNLPSSILIRPVNFASQRERGFDIAATYSIRLSSISPAMPGKLSLNAIATHYISNIVDNGVFPVDYAGVNGDNSFGTLAEPSWSYRVSAAWRADPVMLTFVSRGFSEGVYGNDFVECVSGCPVSTPRYRTINDNHIDGANYIDASIAFDFSSHRGTVTFAVSNLLNRRPTPVGNGPDGNNWPAYAQTNRYLYDVVGRVFRVSMQVGL